MSNTAYFDTQKSSLLQTQEAGRDYSAYFRQVSSSHRKIKKLANRMQSRKWRPKVFDQMSGAHGRRQRKLSELVNTVPVNEEFAKLMQHCSRGVINWMINDQECFFTIQNWENESDKTKQKLLRSIARQFHHHATKELGYRFFYPQINFSKPNEKKGNTSDLAGTCDISLQHGKGQDIWRNTECDAYANDAIANILVIFHECVHSVHAQLPRLYLDMDMPKGLYEQDIDYWLAFDNSDGEMITPSFNHYAYILQMHERVARTATNEFSKSLKSAYKGFQDKFNSMIFENLNMYEPAYQ